MKKLLVVALAFVLLLFAPSEIKEPVPPTVPAESVQQYAKRLAVAKWSTVEWHCLHILWHRESRWNHKAKNPRSSARGIPQMLKMDPRTPAKRQVQLGIKYVSHRYDTPCEALSHHFRRGWY
jgi:hypothetical protein